MSTVHTTSVSCRALPINGKQQVNNKQTYSSSSSRLQHNVVWTAAPYQHWMFPALPLITQLTAPGKTEAVNMAYSLIPCFLLECPLQTSHTLRSEAVWIHKAPRTSGSYLKTLTDHSCANTPLVITLQNSKLLLVMREFMMIWVALAFTTGTLFTLSVEDEGVMTGAFMLASPSSICAEEAGHSFRPGATTALCHDASLSA